MYPTAEVGGSPQQTRSNLKTGGGGRTIAILCPGVWSIRNVVHSGLTERLRAAGIRPHLIVGGPDAWLLESIANQEDCSRLLDAPLVRRARGKPSLDALLRASFCRHHGLSSYRVFNRWRREAETPWQRARNVVVDLLSVPGSEARVLRWQIANLERLTRHTRNLDPVRAHLAGLRPDLVISTACIAGSETPYLMAARDLGIPSLGCILSFDNLTSRSVLPVFDWYAVWNDRMRRQLLTLYPDRAPERIAVTGTPQFDFHVREQCRPARAQTLANLGLSPNDRYLFYGANSVEFTPTEPKLVLDLARACAERVELRGHRIVVRLHPLDDFSRWEPFGAAAAGVVLQRPWSPELGPFNAEEQSRLVGTLLHADACLNIGSTISLDAAVLDTPVVCVAFAGRRGGAEDRFCREVYETEHYEPIAQSGGVRLAGSLAELVDETAAYVREPSRDREGRRRLVQLDVGAADGRATERLAGLIAGLVGARAATVSAEG